MHRWIIGRAVVVACCAVALNACGGDDNGGGSDAESDGSGSSEVRNSTATYTKQDVIDALDLQVDEDYDGTPDRPAQEGDLGMVTPDGECDVSVVLNSKQEVELYAGAGDAVATNPAGNAGVKFSDEPGCGEQLAEGLKSLK